MSIIRSDEYITLFNIATLKRYFIVLFDCYLTVRVKFIKKYLWNALFRDIESINLFDCCLIAKVDYEKKS